MNSYSCDKDSLLSIFKSDTDKMGNDILKMSDFFDVFVNDSNTRIQTKTQWEYVKSTIELAPFITSAIKTGIDISKMGTFVADTSCLSKDTINGLRSGLYHIGSSSKVSGNFQPAIVNDKGRYVEQFTLKKAIDPSMIISDISAMTFQLSLLEMSHKIDQVKHLIEEVIEDDRRDRLIKPFLCARDKVFSASNAINQERSNHLVDADNHLMEGLNSLYIDLDKQINKLAGYNWFFSRKATVDKTIGYIVEDILIINKYIGLKAFLLYYREKIQDVKREFEKYCFKLEEMRSRRISECNCTAFELVHSYYPYSRSNIDYWITRPVEIIELIRKCTNNSLVEKNIYYIEQGNYYVQ